MRVNLFIRVITKATDELRRTLFVAKDAKWSWLRAVEGDFEWLKKLSEEFAHLHSLSMWIADIRCRPVFWRNLVKRIAKAPTANQLEVFQPKPRTNSTIEVPGKVISCSLCAEILPTSSAKALHEYREHGIREPARRYILADNTCRHCSKKFPSRHLCTRHLAEYTTVCLEALRCCVVPLSVEATAILDVHDIEVKKRHSQIKKNGQGGRSVALQFFGPNIIDFRPYYDSLPGAQAC